jgi:hypothetical protein
VLDKLVHFIDLKKPMVLIEVSIDIENRHQNHNAIDIDMLEKKRIMMKLESGFKITQNQRNSCRNIFFIR